MRGSRRLHRCLSGGRIPATLRRSFVCYRDLWTGGIDGKGDAEGRARRELVTFRARSARLFAMDTRQAAAVESFLEITRTSDVDRAVETLQVRPKRRCSMDTKCWRPTLTVANVDSDATSRRAIGTCIEPWPITSKRKLQRGRTAQTEGRWTQERRVERERNEENDVLRSRLRGPFVFPSAHG